MTLRKICSTINSFQRNRRGDAGNRREVKGVSEDEKKYVRSVMFESLRGLQDYLLFLKYGGENRSIPVTDVVDGMLEIVRYLDGETQNQ